MAVYRWLIPPFQGLLLCILAVYLCVQDSRATADHNTVTKTASVAPHTTSVAGHTASMTSNASLVAAHTTSVAAHTTSVATNASSVAISTTSVAAHTTSVATNASSVAISTTSVAARTTSVATNASSVAISTTSVAARTTSVATNASSVAISTTSVAARTTSVATNASSIAISTTSVATNASSIAISTTSVATSASSVATSASSVATSASSVAISTTSVATNAALVAVSNSLVATSTASVASSTPSVVANASSVVTTNTSVNSKEETLLTCQSFQCSGERCYQDEAHTNNTVICHNETYCELYRFSSTNYTARCSSACGTELCGTRSGRGARPCALDCCNSSLCLQLNASSYGYLPHTTMLPMTTTTTRAPPRNGKVCAAFSCHGDGCFKGKKTVARCIVGQDFCEMKKTGLNYVAGCSRACKSAKPVCASGVKAACYQECCPASPKASCLKLDGKVHINSAGQVTLAPLLKLMAYGVVLLLSYRVSASFWE